MNDEWYSAMLRFVVLIEPEGATRLSRSVIVVRARDFEHAKRRAVEVGLGMERAYVGGTGERVAWRLQAIETLDLLGPEITDGREVYSEPAELPPEYVVPFDATFDPAGSEPTHSGV